MRSIDQVLTALHEIAERFSADERPVFHAGASRDTVIAFQATVGPPLPDDFAKFLRQCDAIVAMDVWNGYWVGGVEQLLDSIAGGDYPTVVADKAVVPVATDGGGNAFLLSLGGDAVWKWHHETGRLTQVACNFSSFLERIAEDWQHYLSDDRSWCYLAG